MVMLLVAFVALQHIAFMVLEMFLWEHDAGRKVFGTSREFAGRTSAMAANQGLYNGFLAVGLLYAMWLGDNGVVMIEYLLACIVVAGVYGGLTVNRMIFFVQSLPAALALLLMLT